MRICVNKIRYVGLLMSFLISSLVCMAFPLRSFPPLLLSPSENAFCMMFDHRGVLWIGTNNGLKSYDGYQVRTYRSTHHLFALCRPARTAVGGHRRRTVGV